ncbi:TPA: DUF898 family protein [Streptococcus suis]|nr:DUF898 family protein [Streptococcus suis]
MENNVTVNVYTQNESFFDGGLLSYIGHSLLAALITICTFGICAPWGICIMISWKTKHTVIDGQRLYFDGSAMQLFGNWIKWLLLTIVTLGIYSFWLNIKLDQWITKHTHHIG